MNLQFIDLHTEPPRSLIVVAKKTGMQLTYLVISLACCVLAGHLLDIEYLYRPVQDGPSTHPLTALLFLLLAMALLFQFTHRSVSLGLQFIVASILASLFMFNATSPDQPFLSLSSSKHLADIFNLQPSNRLSGNSFVVIGCMLFSIWARKRRHHILCQALALMSLCIATMALIGYAYHTPALYQDMSLFTVTLSFFLAASVLGISANRGTVRAALSPHLGGQIVRIQCIVGGAFFFGTGYLVFRSLANAQVSSLFGSYMIAVCWFLFVVLMTGASVFEQTDRTRRKQEKKLRAVALYDELTQLLNRRGFKQIIDQQLAHQRRVGGGMGLMLVDIDHFKQVNDRYGHDIGDKVIQHVAWHLRRLVRDTDSVCRYGGEEFAILLPHTEPEGVIIAANTLQHAIEALSMPLFNDSHSETLSVTVSIGCSNVVNGLTEKAFKRADEALYESKRAGRNCVSGRFEAPHSDYSKSRKAHRSRHFFRTAKQQS
ncbi:GGDEF domain-containing protein [Alteromonas sp. AMM-1]|uniref:GGDEF domain-containing protein n=1 Tax=Alteromonas sp. AMM-1 TaxID=3394233 RepID=UPI0039A77F15